MNAPIDWSTLSDTQRADVLARPPQSRDPALRAAVARIIDQVRADGDSSLRALTRRFDGCQLDQLEVSASEFDAAEAVVGAELRQAMRAAAERIAAFHRAGMPQDYVVDTAPGVRCERLSRPLDRAGLYVPAGSAPLPSTALMLAVPAQLAGCSEVILCSPPRADAQVDPAVLVAARDCGVHRVFKLGGAQAIAAMAFGSESVPACDKLFGPGNAYVTEAKLQVSTVAGGPAIDMPAGPSEVLVVADASADAEFVAADLLSQAEHGPDSQAILITDSYLLAERVAEQLQQQATQLSRSEQLNASLKHMRLIVVRSLVEAVALSNRYAPEHLLLNVDDPPALLADVRAAGSVFLGAWSPEALGDYCSGTNHVLPTYGAARAYSGVSVASFLRQITVQSVSPEGLRGIGPDAAILARAEQLDAHESAITRRLARLGAGA